MKSVLIITEDVVKIQTLTGYLGKTFKFIYLNWLKLRLKLIIVILNPFCQLTVVCSDFFKLNHKRTYYYGELLAKIDYTKNKDYYQKLTNKLLSNIKAPLFQTRLAIYLTYHYFIYADLFKDLIKKQKPDLVITLSSSHHEQTARFISKLQNIKVFKPHLFTLVFINNFLKKFFLNREYQKKIDTFLSQAKLPKPNLKKLTNSTLLSLDFHRHLKTLAPIYKELLKQKKNPWLIADVPNLNFAFKNLKHSRVNSLYLASFLPKNYHLNPIQLNLIPKPETELDSFLFNLSIKTTFPLIKHSIVLQDLYLAAAKIFFKLVKPRSLAVVSDLRSQELALSLVAKQTKTKSVLVSPNTLLSFDQLNPYQSTNKVALVGQFIKDQLIAQGLKPQRLHLVGDLRTENYQTLTPKFNLTKLSQTLGLGRNQKIALLISFRSTWMIPQNEKKAFFKLAAEAVSKIPNLKLVIKPHPTEKRYRVIDELKQWGIKAIVSDNNKLELAELLYSSSVVLQTWSMTISEAIRMNRPVISINPFKKDYQAFLPIIKHGGAVEVHQKKALDQWLKILIDPNHPQTRTHLQKAKKASQKFIKPPDGKATQRVVELLA